MRTTDRHTSPGRLVAACLFGAAMLAAGCLFDPGPEEHAPRIIAVTALPATILPDSTTTVTVEADDADGDDLDILWSAPAGSFPAGAAGPRVVWRAPATAGACTLTVQVSDRRQVAIGTVAVDVVQPSPLLALDPPALDFGTGATRRTTTIRNIGTGTLSWTIEETLPWLEIEPIAGTTTREADTLTVTVSRDGLLPGNYVGIVNVRSDGGGASMTVALGVVADPLLHLEPTALDFGDSAVALDLVIENRGTGAMGWSITSSDGWLVAAPSSGTTAATADTVRVEVSRGALPPGHYEGSLAVQADGGDGTVQVGMEVAAPPVYGYRVLHTYPHDPQAFTQGLVYHAGQLLEGTGIRGQSTLRRVALESGEVLDRVDLEAQYFGEGITLFENRIIQLTWTSRIAFVYDATTFARVDSFYYLTQGWGLTHDGSRLIMSDGSATLYFRDPATFEQLGTIAVTDRGAPVQRLNELEYVQGEIYANVWLTDRIARISPETGVVLGWIDLAGLLGGRADGELGSIDRQDVLNGIAYDPGSDRLFVTGKLWPNLFEIELVPPDRESGQARPD